MSQNEEYNPLDYRNLTVNLVRELLSRGPFELPPISRFAGAGVYALFYNGDFVPYASVRSAHATVPIYAGKAIPAGGRKGQILRARSTIEPLFNRLAEHAASIGSVDNVRLEDFTCRYLVVTPLWITMAERFLIEEFQPIWNVALEGFGNHDPGSGRYQGEISWWDAMHPGRAWANRVRQTRGVDEAQLHLADHIRIRDVDPTAARRLAERAAEQELN